jgi:hypothetical protein
VSAIRTKRRTHLFQFVDAPCTQNEAVAMRGKIARYCGTNSTACACYDSYFLFTH